MIVQNKKLIIDASNLREGGGITHIVEILNCVDQADVKFEKVMIYGSRRVLTQIDDKIYLQKNTHWLIERGLIGIVLWKLLFLNRILEKSGGATLFSPTGNYSGRFPCVANMSRNMLVFEETERKRFRPGVMRYKLLLTRLIQLNSFRRSDLIIFISKYAEQYIMPLIPEFTGKTAVIHHGVSFKFKQIPVTQKDIKYYTLRDPYKLLYVSPIIEYKHQWVLIKVIARLRQEGFPIELHLVGYSYKSSYKKYLAELEKIPHNETYIFYHGKVDYSSIQGFYKSADGFIFGSTCENMPNTLVEAMAAGLPIMSSHFGPMPEILGTSKFYFNPTDEVSTYGSLKEFLLNTELRQTEAENAYRRALSFSWETCAKQTFTALYNIQN